jgi:hypothetical protein
MQAESHGGVGWIEGARLAIVVLNIVDICGYLPRLPACTGTVETAAPYSMMDRWSQRRRRRLRWPRTRLRGSPGSRPRPTRSGGAEMEYCSLLDEIADYVRGLCGLRAGAAHAEPRRALLRPTIVRPIEQLGSAVIKGYPI